MLIFDAEHVAIHDGAISQAILIYFVGNLPVYVHNFLAGTRFVSL